MRRRTLPVTAMVLLLVGGPTAAPAIAAPRALLVILPDREARAVIASRGAALGLGVISGTRRATDFVAGIGAKGRFRQGLVRAGVGYAIGASPDAPSDLRAAVERGFGRVSVMPEPPNAGAVVLVLARAEQIPAGAANTIVVGVRGRTPVLIGWLARVGTLRSGDRPRPGFATPNDVRATIFDLAGVPSRTPPLSAEPRPTSVRSLTRLAERLDSDEAGRYALSVALSVALYAPLAIALVFLWGNASRALIRRLSLAVALAPSGYLVGLFLGDAPKAVRVVPVLLAALVGMMLPPSRRSAVGVGYTLLLVAGLLVVGALIAPFRPDGEPALTLWGSPLDLNRHWGLVNHLAALILAGLVGAWVFARLPDASLVAGGVVAAVVCGAAAIGANFVAPLWITFAIWIGVVARRRGQLGVRDLVAAGLAGTAAFAVALVASTAGPASHGSAAVGRIREGGPGAVWDLTRARIDVNLGELTGRGSWFVAWTAFLTVALVAGLVAALQTRERPRDERHAYAGASALAAAGLAALVSEDTGVLVAPVLAALAAAVWIARPRDLNGTEREGARRR